ncbi:MAG: FtsX-like permease family protein [Erysipelotrichaceae bacterium]
MKLSFQIAKRFLTYSKGQTILIMLGIAVGISVQIFIGLLIQGLQASLINTTIGNSAQISIVSEVRGASFSVQDSYLSTLSSDSRLVHVGLSVDGAAFAIVGSKSESTLLRGFAKDTASIYNLSGKLTDGRLPSSNNEVVLGITLAQNLGVKTGDTIQLKTVTGTLRDAQVVGLVDLSVAAINESWVISPASFAQDLFALGNTYTSIEMQVKDVFKADTTATDLTATAPSGLKITNWKTQNAQLLSGLNGQSVSTYMIQVFVLISVILGISSVLAITVLQKSRQIGILKAMGINDSQASLIFIFQGLILGFLGGVLGVALGVGLLVMFTTFAKNPNGTALIPITYNVGFIAFSGSVAVLSALIASIIPARKSRKLSPIEVIRNG